MIPPDFSLTAAVGVAVWLLNVALPTVATIAGLTVGGAVLMWVVRAAKNVLQGF